MITSFKNNGKLKLLIIVSTRQEIIRLSEIIKKCRHLFDVILAHTGQNFDYNLNSVFFRDFELERPEVYLECIGKDYGETMGNVISKTYRLMADTKPDAVLILGDSSSSFSVISAKQLKIPVIHLGAGNTSKNKKSPEEVNRIVIDGLADVNLSYTEHARRNLLQKGIDSEKIYVTGSPMAEVLRKNLKKILESDIHIRLKQKKGNYILFYIHREESISTAESLVSVMQTMNKLADKYGISVLYSCHPQISKKIEQTGIRFSPLVIQHEALGFHDYNALQMNAFCVVSDSGTLPEEASFFTSIGHPFPAVCIRTTTERPEAVDKGIFITSDVDETSLLQAVGTAVELTVTGDNGRPVPDYADENVSAKVVKIIQSHT